VLFENLDPLDWLAETVRPPNYRAVKLRYHHLLIQQGLIPPGHLANRLADADHPLLRGNRTPVRAPCHRRIAPTKRVTQEVKFLFRQFADPRLRFVRRAESNMLLERAGVAVCAYTGVRPGEARGLRWEEWDRGGEQIEVKRSVWRSVEGTPKTEQNNRFIDVPPELGTILLELHRAQGLPTGGYILAREDGSRVNLDNMSKRTIRPALGRCAACREPKSGAHAGHDYQRDATLPSWPAWYGFRRFYDTEIRKESGSSDTMARSLGNSKEVADKHYNHYNKQSAVLPDVRKAGRSALQGLS
jgi:integrase